MSYIIRFTGGNAFLSNFYRCKIVHSGCEFQSAEQLYQYMKSGLPEILEAPDPKTAKQLAKGQSREGIDKFAMMKYVVWNKFKQNTVLRHQLLGTGDKILIEGNAWKDRYWGVDLDSGVGANKLGELLMATRDALRREETVQPPLGGNTSNETPSVDV